MRLTMLLRILIAAIVLLLPQVGSAQQQGDVPPVVLSQGHSQLTSVGVGDQLPSVDVATLEGQAASLADALGQRTTVILFWQGDGWMTKGALRDFALLFPERYAEPGIAFVTVAVDQSVDQTQNVLQSLNFQPTTYVDAEGSGFAQFGTIRLPRVYVVNSQGQIVWFDLEYSQSTRREIAQTLQALLGTQ